MKNTCVNVAGKLPAELIELYADINKHATALTIDFLIVGVMTRDLVLVHGFGSKIERGTRDVNFGVNVADWDEFLNKELLNRPPVTEQFVRDMHRQGEKSLEQCAERFETFAEAFRIETGHSALPAPY